MGDQSGPGNQGTSGDAPRAGHARSASRAWFLVVVGAAFCIAGVTLRAAVAAVDAIEGASAWVLVVSLVLLAIGAVVQTVPTPRLRDLPSLTIDGAIALAASAWLFANAQVGEAGYWSDARIALAGASALAIAVALALMVRAIGGGPRLVLGGVLVLAVVTALLAGGVVSTTADWPRVASVAGLVVVVIGMLAPREPIPTRVDDGTTWLHFLPIVPAAIAAALALARPELTDTSQRWALVGVVAIALLRQAWETGRSHGDLRKLEHTLGALHHAARHDPLTKLANRSFFHEQVERASTTQRGNAIGVLFIDVDDFKTTNDTLGHAAGDELLVQVAERLLAASRSTDTVARLGGDEFGILLNGLGHPSQAEELSGRVLEAMRPNFVLGGSELRVTISIGVATQVGGRSNGAQLLRQADMALYSSKRRGKNQYRSFSWTMQRDAVERFDLQTELREAIEAGRIEPHYQPIVQLDTGLLIGFEALARWDHSTRGMVPPDRFIPLAEELGLIHTLGLSMLRSACRQLAAWNASWAGTRPLHVAVNVSARQFDQSTLLADIVGVLSETGIAASQIVVEVTESSVMEDPQSVLKTLQGLRAIGIRVAIDDFGTGYSALQYLREFPVDTLKIDRSFVTDADGNRASATLLQAMIELGHSLGLRTVAEGVETQPQMQTLSRLGCDMVQGNLLATPAGPAQTTALLRALAARSWVLIPGLATAAAADHTPAGAAPSVAGAR